MNTTKKTLAALITCSSISGFANASGADASDPTAAVNFVDTRYQSFDLGDVSPLGDSRDRFAVEGSHVFTPEHKISYELNYWDTDITGEDESDFESFSTKYINLSPGELGGVKYKLALGAELIMDLGDVDDGIGSGTDQIAPLVGAGWLFSETNFLITLVQYFHSFDEDPGVEEVRKTGPRLIWIHKIPQHQAWLKVDNKFSIDHENDEQSSNTVELQVGKMMTEDFGMYLDYSNNTGGQKSFDDAFGIGLRFMY